MSLKTSVLFVTYTCRRRRVWLGYMFCIFRTCATCTALVQDALGEKEWNLEPYLRWRGQTEEKWTGCMERLSKKFLSFFCFFFKADLKIKRAVQRSHCLDKHVLHLISHRLYKYAIFPKSSSFFSCIVKVISSTTCRYIKILLNTVISGHS